MLTENSRVRAAHNGMIRRALNRKWVLLLCVLSVIGACNHAARYSVEEGSGAHPVLPAPTQSLIPTLKIAKATGWPQGAAPTAADGLKVNAFATGLDHP